MIKLVLIGDELLDGRIINTNEQTISRHLYDHGFNVNQSVTVGDDLGTLLPTLKQAIHESDVCITTGGLGPTEDDRTTAAIATITNTKLIRDESVYQHIKDYFERSGRTFPETNAKQADFPEHAIILDNPHGTAPGFALNINNKWIFSMPGVPKEMIPMLKNNVLPLMEQYCSHILHPRHVRLYKCFGLGESHLAERISDLYPLPKGFHISFQAKMPEVHIRLIKSSNEYCSEFQRLQKYCDKTFHDVCFTNDADIDYIQHVIQTIRAQKKTIALAESCTGGLAAQLITQYAGVSDIFLLSAVSYSNHAKTSLIDVNSHTLNTYGAVSAEVAEAMASGALKKSGADIAVSVSGVAGPDGGSDEKPVGTVFFGVATKENVSNQKRFYPMSRHSFQKVCAYQVLQLLLKSA